MEFVKEKQVLSLEDVTSDKHIEEDAPRASEVSEFEPKQPASPAEKDQELSALEAYCLGLFKVKKFLLQEKRDIFASLEVVV